MRSPRKRYPSVTEVLEAYVNFDRVSKSVLEAAKGRGTAVHSLCAKYATYGVALNIPDQYKGYLESCAAFFRKVEKVIAVERRIYNDALRLTGQVDLVAILEGDSLPRVIDLKTPTSVYRTWKAQVSAYKMLYEHEYQQITDSPLSVRLKPDGSGYLLNYVDNHAEELKMFNMALTLYNYYVL